MMEESDSGRRLRSLERKHYTDEDLSDDEIDGKRLFSVEEKLASDMYQHQFVKEMTGEEVTYKYFQQNAFRTPMLVKDKTGLGMRVPSANFKVSDVKQCVGSRRMVDVMDVTTQKGMEMTMKEWVQYYDDPDRDKLLNVISLEFSHTRLDHYVECPQVVRQMDWVDCVWPSYLKYSQSDGTNVLDKMKYPKVQKYCLMSVGGCYTDFHIDFGGTSVWYHILHGAKIFWLIPPTERNLALYEDWILSGKQGEFFFADQVEACQRIKLEEGYTFFIPTGWIHAVYTPVDSLVFGGNFIHSFNMTQQLQMVDLEEKVHVPNKFRYPFFTEMMWYVLARYAKLLSGKSFLAKIEEDKMEGKSDKENKQDISDDTASVTDVKEGSVSPDSVSPPQSPVMVEHSYVQSPSQSPRAAASPLPADVTLKTAVVVLKDAIRDSKSPKPSSVKSSPSSKSSSPNISDKDEVGVGKSDDSGKKNTNSEMTADGSGDASSSRVKQQLYLTSFEMEGLNSIVGWLSDLAPTKKSVPKDLINPQQLISLIKQLLIEHKGDDPALAITGEPLLKGLSVCLPKKIAKLPKSTGSGGKSSGPKPLKKTDTGNRRRRTRCKKCEACTREDCRECHFCKDMKKYGGPGRMKQSCISRQCMAPILPYSSACMICGTDERIKIEDSTETYTLLMECGICWDIVHPACLKEKYENLDNEAGIINEDLPNSWKCPKCCHDGKEGQLKPRLLKGVKRESRQNSADSDTKVKVKTESADEVQAGTSHDNENTDSKTNEKDSAKEKKESPRRSSVTKQPGSPITGRVTQNETKTPNSPGCHSSNNGISGRTTPSQLLQSKDSGSPGTGRLTQSKIPGPERVTQSKSLGPEKVSHSKNHGPEKLTQSKSPGPDKVTPSSSPGPERLTRKQATKQSTGRSQMVQSTRKESGKQEGKKSSSPSKMIKKEAKETTSSPSNVDGRGTRKRKESGVGNEVTSTKRVKVDSPKRDLGRMTRSSPSSSVSPSPRRRRPYREVVMPRRYL